jgi:hypothetical protein
MKSVYRIFLIILCAASVVTCQTATQQGRVSNVKGPHPNESILSDEQLIDKFEKTTVSIKGTWRLINPATKKQIYHLYVSRKQLAKAGVKVSGDAEAVPVYVKTADEYEPILVEDKGQHNHLVAAFNNGMGSIVTTDGFILTTRRVVSAWDSALDFAANAPKGIVMSADLKQILDSNAPPPLKWIPTNTKPRSGMLGTFNIRVKSSGEYAGENDSLYVRLPGGDLKAIKARLTQSSTRNDLALIKIATPQKLTKVEFYDNFDALKKGQNVFIVYADLKDAMLGKLTVMTTSVSDITLQTKETGNVIRLESSGNNFGIPVSNAQAANGREYFKALSLGYAGSPVFDNQGRIIGIYAGYTWETNLHQVVPIRHAGELLGK